MKFGVFVAPLMFDPNDQGGAPAPSATPGGDTGAAAPSASAGQPAASAAQPNAQPSGFTYKEDRSNWVPSHVVRQQTERLRQMERDYYVAQQRVAALSGVQPPAAPEDPEQAAIRQQFNKLYPGLAKLETMADKLQRAAEFDYDGVQQSVRGTTQQMWESHGNQMSRVLFDKARDAYGGAELSPKAMGRIANAFAWELQNDEQVRQRYEAGDLTVLDEFIADYKGTVLDPYRRSTQAASPSAIPGVRRLPRGGGNSAIVGGRPENLKPSDAGFHNAAFKRFTNGG